MKRSWLLAHRYLMVCFNLSLNLILELEICHLFDFQPKTRQPKAKMHINGKKFAQKLQ